MGGGGQNSPVTHIIQLSKALQAFQTRLLYVSLPLKLSIYPELVARDSTFFKGASTLPQFRQMTLELLQNGVEVLDFSPIFMQHKKEGNTHLFSKGHHISYEGASLVAQTLGEYIRRTTNFTPDNAHFNAQKTLCNSYAKTTIYKEGEIYLADKKDSPFCIFGNCNLQAYAQEGAGIASNLAFALNKEIDYLGRKLIFWDGENESFDKETFEECCKRDIAICISFLSGSFVRTSAVSGITKRKAIGKIIWKTLRGKKFMERKWSTLALKEAKCHNKKTCDSTKRLMS